MWGRRGVLAAALLLFGMVATGCDEGGDPSDVIDDASLCPPGCPDSECLLETGECRLDACLSDTDCGADAYCDTEIGYCRSGCQVGRLCVDGRVCVGASRSCTACHPTMAPCTMGVCVDGRCINCIDDADCGLGTGQLCNSFNQCVEGCRGEENCPTSQRCDLTRAVCVECTEDAHCGTGTCDVESGVCM